MGRCDKDKLLSHTLGPGPVRLEELEVLRALIRSPRVKLPVRRALVEGVAVTGVDAIGFLQRFPLQDSRVRGGRKRILRIEDVGIYEPTTDKSSSPHAKYLLFTKTSRSAFRGSSKADSCRCCCCSFVGVVVGSKWRDSGLRSLLSFG